MNERNAEISLCVTSTFQNFAVFSVYTHKHLKRSKMPKFHSHFITFCKTLQPVAHLRLNFAEFSRFLALHYIVQCLNFKF
jgi:hypothetical protein